MAIQSVPMWTFISCTSLGFKQFMASCCIVTIIDNFQTIISQNCTARTILWISIELQVFLVVWPWARVFKLYIKINILIYNNINNGKGGNNYTKSHWTTLKLLSEYRWWGLLAVDWNFNCTKNQPVSRQINQHRLVLVIFKVHCIFRVPIATVWKVPKLDFVVMLACTLMAHLFSCLIHNGELELDINKYVIENKKSYKRVGWKWLAY
jgi:hypothetical protein